MSEPRLKSRNQKSKSTSIEGSSVPVQSLSGLIDQNPDDEPKRKRQRFTFEEKKKILQESNVQTTEYICNKYEIHRQTLKKWKAKKKQIYEAALNSSTFTKKKIINVSEELDNALYLWLLNSVYSGTPVTGSMIKRKALILNAELGGNPDFKASNGWFEKWKQRKNGFSIQSFASAEAMTVTCEPWGSVEGQGVKKFTLKNGQGFEVDVLSYGATIQAIRTPDKKGNIADVVLGFDNIEGYLGSDNPYFGATVGRVANRIGGAKFVLDKVTYTLYQNIPGNTLHGGLKAWDKKIWNATIKDDAVWMTLLSSDGEEGYPGAVIATVKFSLTKDGRLVVKMTAVSTKATPINLTNHSYFNLFGNDGNATELYKHEITINADRWTVTDEDSIPTGEIRPVANSIMDLRIAKRLGDVLPKVPGGGYDFNFCIPEDDGPKGDRFVARVLHPDSGRYLEVYSNQPGVQLYTSNFLPDVTAKGVLGKNGQQYFKHGAFCLETQNFPDAINHENFPNSILRPGETYEHTVTYKFGVQDQ